MDQNTSSPTFSQTLIQAGLNYGQASVYEVLLKNGPLKASNIATKTTYKREMIYRFLDELISYGLVIKSEKGSKVAIFEPSHPNNLMAFIDQQEQKTRLAKDAMRGVLPLLVSQYTLSLDKPGIEYFEGEEGLDHIGADSLTAEGEVLQYIDNEAVHKFIPEFNARYRKQRNQLKIKKRMLALDSEFIRLQKDKYLKYELTEIRLVSSPTPFATVMQIYNNKVSYISLDEKKLVCVLITDEHISRMHKTLFEALWAKSTPLSQV